MNNRKMEIKFRFAVLLIFISVVYPLYAVENCEWVETTGEATIKNITSEEAAQLAKNTARLDAIERVSGVKIQSSTLVKNLKVVVDLINATSTGYILDEKAIWSSSSFQEKEDTPPIITYTVKLQSCVKSELIGDPYFKINAKLNKEFFEETEDATITATCTKDCYLTIANLKNDMVKILVPGYEQSPFIESGETYIFPQEGAAVKMPLLQGQTNVSEAFILIATKERFDMSSLSNGEIPLKDFYRKIISLPSDTRTMESLWYEVRGR